MYVGALVPAWEATLESVRLRLRGGGGMWTASDFARFANSPVSEDRLYVHSSRALLGELAKEAPSLTPEMQCERAANQEELFATWQRLGAYSEMWHMLVREAQASWGHMTAFRQVLLSQAATCRLLDAHVEDAEIISRWADPKSGRVHPYVARLSVRYTFFHQMRELPVRHTVHWVPEAGSWLTPLYKS